MLQASLNTKKWSKKQKCFETIKSDLIKLTPKILTILYSADCSAAMWDCIREAKH